MPRKTKQVIENAAPAKVENGLGEALGAGVSITDGGNVFSNGPNAFSEQISSIGTVQRNLRNYMISNQRQVLSQMYVEIGLVQTIVDVPVDDGLRGGIDIKSKQLDEDQIQELQIALDRDDDINTCGQAAKWNRLFGGAGIMIMTDQDPSTPLNMEALTEDSPLEFRAVDMWELNWDKQNVEGFNPTLTGNDSGSEFYSYYAVDVHKSRVMQLKGLAAPSFIRPRLRGWGFSVCETLIRSINQYLKATDLSFEVLDEFKIDVYKIKGLVNSLFTPNGSNKIKERVQLANWQKNYQNAIVMDGEDDYDHKQLSFAGLAEAMDGIRMQVAADMRMPRSKLFGEAGSGLNSGSNEGDLEVYNAMVESQIRNKLKYDLVRMCEIKCQKLFGMVPDDLSITFKPLRMMNAEQEENVKTQKMNRLVQAQAAGMITPEEFKDACNHGDLFDIQIDTSIDQIVADDPTLSEDGEADNFTDDDGADTSDLIPTPERKGRARTASTTEEPGGYRHKRGGDDEQNPEPREKDPENKEPKNNPPRNLRNGSAAFDKASYLADGGDNQQDSRRAPLFDGVPMGADAALWKQAMHASHESMGEQNWKFALWWYEKNGGLFE